MEPMIDNFDFYIIIWIYFFMINKVISFCIICNFIQSSCRTFILMDGKKKEKIFPSKVAVADV